MAAAGAKAEYRPSAAVKNETSKKYQTQLDEEKELNLQEMIARGAKPLGDQEYAKALEALALSIGLEPVKDDQFMWMAKDALNAQLPENWVVIIDDNDNRCYYNKTTTKTHYDHPHINYYRSLFKQQLERRNMKRQEQHLVDKLESNDGANFSLIDEASTTQLSRSLQEELDERLKQFQAKAPVSLDDKPLTLKLKEKALRKQAVDLYEEEELPEAGLRSLERSEFSQNLQKFTSNNRSSQAGLIAAMKEKEKAYQSQMEVLRVRLQAVELRSKPGEDSDGRNLGDAQKQVMAEVMENLVEPANKTALSSQDLAKNMADSALDLEESADEAVYAKNLAHFVANNRLAQFKKFEQQVENREKQLEEKLQSLTEQVKALETAAGGRTDLQSASSIMTASSEASRNLLSSGSMGFGPDRQYSRGNATDVSDGGLQSRPMSVPSVGSYEGVDDTETVSDDARRDWDASTAASSRPMSQESRPFSRGQHGSAPPSRQNIQLEQAIYSLESRLAQVEQGQGLNFPLFSSADHGEGGTMEADAEAQQQIAALAEENKVLQQTLEVERAEWVRVTKDIMGRMKSFAMDAQTTQNELIALKQNGLTYKQQTEMLNIKHSAKCMKESLLALREEVMSFGDKLFWPVTSKLQKANTVVSTKVEKIEQTLHDTQVQYRLASKRVQELEISRQVERHARVEVIARVRPLLPWEREGDLDCPKSKPTLLSLTDSETGLKHDFEVDKLLRQTTDQRTMFDTVSSHALALFSGQSAIIVAHGAPSTGKSYTMQGNLTDPGLHQSMLEAVLTYSDTLSERHPQIDVCCFDIYTANNEEKMSTDLVFQCNRQMLTKCAVDTVLAGPSFSLLRLKRESKPDAICRMLYSAALPDAKFTFYHRVFGISVTTIDPSSGKTTVGRLFLVDCVGGGTSAGGGIGSQAVVGSGPTPVLKTAGSHFSPSPAQPEPSVHPDESKHSEGSKPGKSEAETAELVKHLETTVLGGESDWQIAIEEKSLPMSSLALKGALASTLVDGKLILILTVSASMATIGQSIAVLHAAGRNSALRPSSAHRRNLRQERQAMESKLRQQADEIARLRGVLKEVGRENTSLQARLQTQEINTLAATTALDGRAQERGHTPDPNEAKAEDIIFDMDQKIYNTIMANRVQREQNLRSLMAGDAHYRDSPVRDERLSKTTSALDRSRKSKSTSLTKTGRHR